ncbi:MAG: class I SAM-dependent methyltransferase [Planctomycetota bacterium]|jgi:acetylserotonin N-methyltransferase
MSISNPPDPTLVLDLLEAFRRSKTMFAAVELGVFDAIHEQPDSAEALAARLQTDTPSLQTLLESCVALGLLVLRDHQFANTESTTAYLCSHSERRMTGYIKYSNQVIWQLWAHLEDAIREGTHRWNQTYGLDGPIFSSFFRTPESMHEFLMGMHGFGMITSPKIVRCFDLSRFHHLCDLGGATGHLPMAACECYPHLRATVYDLPHALGLANEIIRVSSVAERISVVGGDFFVDPLPRADLYALGRILHDWNETKIRRLLQRIYEALPASGGLLIGEKIIAEDRSGPRWALMQSLNMLVCTEGRERSFSEYRELLRETGFTEIQHATTDVPLDAILAIK